MGDELTTVLCVESTKLRYGPDSLLRIRCEFVALNRQNGQIVLKQ